MQVLEYNGRIEFIPEKDNAEIPNLKHQITNNCSLWMPSGRGKEMPALGKMHGQDAVADVQDANKIDRQVGRRPAVGLHVGVRGFKKILAARYG